MDARSPSVQGLLRRLSVVQNGCLEYDSDDAFVQGQLVARSAGTGDMLLRGQFSKGSTSYHSVLGGASEGECVRVMSWCSDV